jgi:FkbH-like protein
MTVETSTADDARRAFRGSLEAGDLATAMRAARTLLGNNPQGGAASFICRAVEKAPPDRLPLATLRVALLSSFSIEFIHDVLVALGFLEGLRIQIYQAGFGQFRQEILNPDSGLYAFSPDAAVLALEGKDVLPALYGHDLPDGAANFESTLTEAGQELATLARVFRERSSAALLIHNFAPPTWRRLGILDGQLGAGQVELVAALNATLSRVCREFRGVYTVDYAGLVHRAGALSWYDDRMAHYARAPIAQTALPLLALEYVKFFRALTGKTRKCLVLDLDNTLWGGILGEEGPQGIQLGPDYPGSAYLEFQRAIRGLRQRGVILAVASKNNPADVDEVFATHPHMVLRREDFSILRVGWSPKSQCLAEIAAHLNIAPDHMVFMDDNPAECDEISHALPGVTVVTLPPRPEHFARTLLEPGYFDSLSVSSEDLRRAELYQQRDQAEELRTQSVSIEDFYRRLDMDVTFTPVHDGSLARAAQLTQKTNQFNVRTIRYTEADLLERRTDPAWLVTTVHVRDRFGDNGIVGFMMARAVGDELEIDTLLLSCRVIGRTVETAMLAHLCEDAAQRGIRRLRGRITATAKNAPAQDLYERHGFRLESGKDSVETSWGLDLGAGAIRYPEWMKITSEVSAP